MTHRVEHDSLGPVRVPNGALWGAHTQRALTNFTVSGTPVGVHRSLVRALGTVKAAAAHVNSELGLIPSEVGEAIIDAAHRVIRGDVDEAFVVDVIQGGAGTSVNMNANEVIANLALSELGLPLGNYAKVNPIDHVNRCQSTNDVYPTAVRLSLLFALEPLLDSLDTLAGAFEERGTAFAKIPKLGRTQLQDAVPMTLGQEFTAFAVTLREDHARLLEAATLLRECSLGATAIGTGITADEEYRARVVDRLAEISGQQLTRAHDLIEATWDTGAFVQFSGVLKRTATKLSKISSDLRLLSSGPEAGFAEIILPARQAGSSIMPGKVNPVIPEMMNQIAFFTIGADLTVTLAAEHGQLQLNAFEPAIAHALLQTMTWLTRGTETLAELCIAGINVNASTLSKRSGNTTAEVTALVPHIGYEAATRLAHAASRGGPAPVDTAEQNGLIDSDLAKTLRDRVASLQDASLAVSS